MSCIRIADLTIQVEAEFKVPQLACDIDPMGFIRAVVSVAGEYVVDQGVLYNPEDKAFAFAITIPLFNRSAEVCLTARSIKIVFRSLQANAVVKAATGYICSLHGILEKWYKHTSINISGLFTFENKEQCDDYFGRFSKPLPEISSSGVVHYSEVDGFNGLTRFLLERSMANPSGIFIYTNLQTGVAISDETFNRLENWLVKLLAAHDLKIVEAPNA